LREVLALIDPFSTEAKEFLSQTTSISSLDEKTESRALKRYKWKKSDELIPNNLLDNYSLTEIRIMAKTLTMLMVTLFFCESFLVFQIRRPNKSLIRSLKEDSNKRMYLIIGLLFAVFLMLMYIPNAQVALAKAGINFMFMYLTALDWLICFSISLICIITFEAVKYAARKFKISF